MKRKTFITHLCSCCTSIVCMAQMGASLATAGSAGMVAMTATQAPFLASMLQAIGLGFLVALPDSVLRPALIIVLAITVFGAWLSYKFHQKPIPLALTVIGSVSIYSSIYVFASEAFYWLSFVLLLIAAFLNHKAERGL